MSSLRRICLVGVRGVGKSTLVRAVAPELPTVDHVVGSAVLRELAGPDFARFDHLPPHVKHDYRVSAIEWMVRRQSERRRHILCDGHTSLLDESSGLVGPVFTEADCRFFRELVLMDATVDIVLERRQGDPSRRRSQDPSVVAEELAGERTTSERIAREWGMLLHRLPVGDDGRIRDTFREILQR